MSKQTSPLKAADLPLPSNTYKGATLARGLHFFVMFCVGMMVFMTAFGLPLGEDSAFGARLIGSVILWIIPALVISMFTRVIADTICAIFDLRQIALHMATRMDEHFEAYWIDEDEDEGLEN